MQKRNSWIGAVSAEQIDTQNQFGIEVYCGIQSRLFGINLTTLSSIAICNVV